jgi:hypothetical protein
VDCYSQKLLVNYDPLAALHDNAQIFMLHISIAIPVSAVTDSIKMNQATSF